MTKIKYLAVSALFGLTLASGCSDDVTKIYRSTDSNFHYWIDGRNRLVSYRCAIEGDSITFRYDGLGRLDWVEMAEGSVVRYIDITYGSDGNPLSAVVTAFEGGRKCMSGRKFIDYEISEGKVSKMKVVEDNGASYEMSYIYSEGNPTEVRTKGNAGTVINKIRYGNRRPELAAIKFNYILAPELPQALFSEREVLNQTYEFREDSIESTDMNNA
ncbi:exported hypothetical protein [Sphingobacterium sp. PM2-P1-29]|nr:exported hypothetical protein [Sphingobacterium sp. PM2-P1-29]